MKAAIAQFPPFGRKRPKAAICAGLPHLETGSISTHMIQDIGAGQAGPIRLLTFVGPKCLVRKTVAIWLQWIVAGEANRQKLDILTRIEIDGFKTFEGFGLDLEPLTAVVGPNASGKSNLFDALRFLSLLTQHDIRTAMQGLRGEPEELFRQTPVGNSDCMSFAVEVLLSRRGVDAFGTNYEISAQRLRYQLKLGNL